MLTFLALTMILGAARAAESDEPTETLLGNDITQTVVVAPMIGAWSVDGVAVAVVGCRAAWEAAGVVALGMQCQMSWGGGGGWGHMAWHHHDEDEPASPNDIAIAGFGLFVEGVVARHRVVHGSLEMGASWSYLLRGEAEGSALIPHASIRGEVNLTESLRLAAGPSTRLFVSGSGPPQLEPWSLGGEILLKWDMVSMHHAMARDDPEDREP